MILEYRPKSAGPNLTDLQRSERRNWWMMGLMILLYLLIPIAVMIVLAVIGLA